MWEIKEKIKEKFGIKDVKKVEWKKIFTIILLLMPVNFVILISLFHVLSQRATGLDILYYQGQAVTLTIFIGFALEAISIIIINKKIKGLELFLLFVLNFALTLFFSGFAISLYYFISQFNFFYNKYGFFGLIGKFIIDSLGNILVNIGGIIMYVISIFGLS